MRNRDRDIITNKKALKKCKFLIRIIFKWDKQLFVSDYFFLCFLTSSYLSSHFIPLLVLGKIFQTPWHTFSPCIRSHIFPVPKSTWKDRGWLTKPWYTVCPQMDLAVFLLLIYIDLPMVLNHQTEQESDSFAPVMRLEAVKLTSFVTHPRSRNQGEIEDGIWPHS